jgi:hypothetical protein
MKKILLHLEKDAKASAFDQITAYDAGVDMVIPYGGVLPEEVENLVYGTIFTRGADKLRNTAIFVGGTNVAEAEELFERVEKTFFASFRVSVMFDANGSNTTAAAAVVKILSVLGPPSGQKAVVLAGTGPVGTRAAVLLAKEGCRAFLSSRSFSRAQEACRRIKERFGMDVVPLEVKDDAGCRNAIDDAQVVFCTGKPGALLLKKEIWSTLPALKVIADVNAVDPPGVEGTKAADNGREREGKIIFGALGIGNFKMKVHKEAIARLFDRNDQVMDVFSIFDLAKNIQD